MKSTIKYTVLIAITFTLFVSCNQEKTTKTEIPKSENKFVKNFEDCSEKGVLRYKICEDMAYDYLSRYNSYIDDVRDDLKKYDPTVYENTRETLNYGSHTTVREFRNILKNTNFKDDDKIFLMNGMKQRKVDGKDVTEVIFVVESFPRGIANAKSSDGPTYTYFNFTQPCPNGCPKEIPGITYPE